MSYKSVKQECLTRALRNSVKQGCPTRVSPQCVRSGCPTSGFGGKCDKYCFCSSTHVSAFGFVGFILFFCVWNFESLFNWDFRPPSREVGLLGIWHLLFCTAKQQSITSTENRMAYFDAERLKDRILYTVSDRYIFITFDRCGSKWISNL